MFKKIYRWFFEPYREPVSALATIIWWEKRRIPFNFIVGTYGAISLVIFFWAIGTSGQLEPGEDAVEPMALLVAPILINICYTTGWIVEIFLRLLDCTITSRLGAILLKIGVVFSLFLISIPSFIWVLIRLFVHNAAW